MNKMRRKWLLASAAMTTIGFLGFNKLKKTNHISHAMAAPAAHPRLGINLSGVADWATEFPFVDLFKQSRAWFYEHDESAVANLDENGWVTSLPEGKVVSTIVSVIEGQHFPAEEYVVLYDGEGDIDSPNHALKNQSPGRATISVKGNDAILQISIKRTNPKNYIRNIRLVPVASEKSHKQLRWDARFLARWSGVSCLRFMDFMQTNNSKQVAWEDRPQPSHASFAEKGVPVEWMVDLANELNCDPWFCMPHQADDGYIKAFANYVAQHLKPELRAWVEYSNELWNGGFEQYAYAAEKGRSLGLSSDDWGNAYRYNARRSVEVFDIWQQAFSQDKRLVKVIASQGANIALAEQLLKSPQVSSSVDVLAIAPYVSFNVSPEGDDETPSAGTVKHWQLARLFKHLETVALPASKAWMHYHKKLADKYGLSLVAYEGGQHLVGVQGAEHDGELTDLLMRANADQRMGEIYTKNLQDWEEAGGDLFCHFSSVESWSKWGSWGLQQYMDDQLTPKRLAVVAWAKSLGQKVM